ncbi:hypothetical protein MMC07_007740 [Pseudocyphellaria aurata]|nr:hypothetical protein [Pseudocyphellaria aurata]
MSRYLIVALFLHTGFLYLWLFFGQGSLQLSRIFGDDQFNPQSPAGLATATAFELEGLLREPYGVLDFASMANRIVKFGVLADLTMTEKTVDEAIIFSLLGKHFPWWQPEQSTYIPWHRRQKSDSHDTGIVICVGSRNKLYAIHLIRILRDVLHSKLPIEIAYGGDGDLPFKDRRDFMALDDNIRLINLVDLFDESVGSLRHGGFAMKPFAMLASRFRRVIMADADAIFLRAPDQLFKSEPGLVETGTFFWHDRAFKRPTATAKPWVESLLGARGPSPSLSQTTFWTDGLSEQQDSAVVCMDKGRPKVFMSLLFSVWMNLKVVREQVTYKNTLGDKESFWLAAELTQTPYHFNPWYASCLGILKNHNTVCGSQAGQRDSRGDLLWYNGSMRRDKWKPGRQLANITHWMGGHQNWSSLTQWYLDPQTTGPTASLWCLRGDSLTSVDSLDIWSEMQTMVKVVNNADDRYFDPHQSYAPPPPP